MRVMGVMLVAGVAGVAGMAAWAGTAENALPCGPNAALRYWMAFAQIENPPAQGEVARRLENVAEGREPWAESLASIVSHNEQALATMHRGTRLPCCDWGYEYERLAEAPIANVARARTLARLNVLHGTRLWQQGRRPEAVSAWLAGVRFSQDIAAEGPILSALVAGRSLRAHLGALARAAGEHKLDAAGTAQIERSIAALPEAGFDWSAAVRLESQAHSALVARLERGEEPLAKLGEYFGGGGVAGGVPGGVVGGVVGGEREGELARLIGLTPAQLADPQALRATLGRTRALNDELRSRLVAALQAPYAGSQAVVRELDTRAGEDPLLGRMWSSAARLNEARGEVVQARAELLAVLQGR